MLRPYISEAWESKGFGYKESRDEATGLSMMMLEGEFQRAEKQNRNMRIYREQLLKRETNKLIDIINERGGHPMGMNHPIPDGTEQSMIYMQSIDLDNACGLTKWLEMSDKVVYGKATALVGDNGSGDKLASFVKHGYKPGVSSRGMGGDAEHINGMTYVPEDYIMICYDFVTSPSTHNAVLNKVIQEEIQFLEHMNSQKADPTMWSVLIDLKNKNIRR